jgi:uncharacterized DUF497 family protein
VKIIWDEPKRLANLDKHGMDFADVNDRFFDAAFVLQAARNRYRRKFPRRHFRALRYLWQ